jgi:hypothetical protein
MSPPASRSICSRCTANPKWRRAFSTTPSRHSVGPESPRFISVPEALQTPKPPKPVVKGILPVPRSIFKDEKKASNDYLDKTAPVPRKTIAFSGHEADRLAWKQRMAESRRANLKQGVRELLERKEVHERIENIHSTNRRERHERLANKPEREDERLTNPSLHNSVRRILAGPITYPSPTYPKPNKTLIQQAKKSAERKDALHTLYTHARNFIVTEEAMNEALDKAFGTDDNPMMWNHDGNSIWSTGDPASLRDMLDKDKALNVRARTDLGVVESVAQKRMRRIAEEFTGGRIVKNA